jgi:DNA-binding beta-propeller fold protein YncE
VAVQSRNELAAIDPLSETVVDRIPLPGIERPHGLAVDAANRLIYLAGERNGMLGVLDLRTRRVAHSYRVGQEPDVLALDSERRRLFVAAESGVITPFRTAGDSLLPLPPYRVPHGHSVAVDPSTGLLYVPLEDLGGEPVLRILRLE